MNTETANPGAQHAGQPPAALLAAATAHLRRLGLATAEERPRWRLLAGGVSNWVLHTDSGGGVVVKAALARLRVPEEWLADPTRAVLEGRAMQVLWSRLPAGDVPEVLFVDEVAHLLGMRAAPPDTQPWKEALLRGDVDLHAARQVGALLGRMHAATGDDPALAAAFGDLALFRQLRLHPYHEHAARAAEARGDRQLAAALRAGAVAMERDRRTLVHGDFSPKNLLVGDAGVLALDFEVVHWGNPDFDTAFLLTHLALKALHRPDAAAAYARAAGLFFEGYADAHPSRAPRAILSGALAQAGCLLVARADGKSPAEYLDAAGRARARRLGAAVLLGGVAEIEELFEEGT